MGNRQDPPTYFTEVPRLVLDLVVEMIGPNCECGRALADAEGKEDVTFYVATNGRVLVGVKDEMEEE